MIPSKLIGGPDQYWSGELPPSRGQYKDIALVALELLGIPAPQTRLEATIAMVRLRAAVSEAPPRGGTGGVVSARLDIQAARAAIRMPVGEAQDLIEHEASSLAERRVLRQRRGRNGQQPRCRGCNKFLRSTGGRCPSCGFHQDIGWAA